jgi:hypothetical protein
VWAKLAQCYGQELQITAPHPSAPHLIFTSGEVARLHFDTDGPSSKLFGTIINDSVAELVQLRQQATGKPH